VKYLDFDSIFTKDFIFPKRPRIFSSGRWALLFQSAKNSHINTFVERNNQNLGEAAIGLFAQAGNLSSFKTPRNSSTKNHLGNPHATKP